MDLGVYTRAELLARELTDFDIRRMIRRGELIRLRSGWFATPDADPDAITAAKRFGAVSCVTALRKDGLWVPPGYDAIHVRSAKYARSRRRDFCAPPGRPLPVTTVLDPIPVALACAAGCMSAEDWVAVCDSFMNSRGIDQEQLLATMPKSSARIEWLLARCDPASQSGTESIVRFRLRSRGFHVEVQPRINGVGHVDLGVGRLLLECDSKQYHLSPESYQKDRKRDRTSIRQRYTTMRLTYDDVLFGWEETLEDIRAFTSEGRHRKSRSTRSCD